MSIESYCVEVRPEWVDTRLDRLDLSDIVVVSRSRFQILIHAGEVRVNRECVKPSYRLRSGDMIAINIPSPTPLNLEAQDIPFGILYEDADLIVVDKPRGLVVHPGAGVKDRTLVNALLHHCKDLSGIGGVVRPGIVHRLDKGTSGVIIAAKNDHAHLSLATQFASRTMEKEYLALAFGQTDWQTMTVEQPIGRHLRNRIKMAVTETGRYAKTLFNLIAYDELGSLVSAHPSSGRTHQIRVHLDFIKHPVLGDPLYGLATGKRLPGTIQKTLKMMDGFCLHATRLVFSHPRTGARMEIKAGIPEDFRRVMESLQLQYLHQQVKDESLIL